MSGLTTHVLDLVAGRPAAGVRIAVARIEDGVARPLAEALTNADGRIDGPLLSGDAMTAGVYELTFYVGAYFMGRTSFAEKTSSGVQELPFLDAVPVRFGVADPAVHYHVPLLVTPWSFSTYRGS